MSRVQSPDRKLSSIRRSLLVEFPFLGSILSSMEFIPDSNIQRFAIHDGTVHYREDYLDTTTPVEARFQLARSVLHVALNHGPRRGLRNRDLWSLCTDIAVDGILEESGLADGVSGVLIMRNMRGMSAEEIYSILTAEAGIPAASLFNAPESSTDAPTQETLADRISSARKVNRSLVLKSMREGMGTDTEGGQYSARMREIVAGARITAIMAGKNSVPVEIQLRDSAIQRISIRRILEPHMEPDRTARSTSRFSRKYMDAGIYIPGRGRKCMKAVIALDVSASVDPAMADAFFSDIADLIYGLQPEEEVRLIQFDSDIVYDQLFSGPLYNGEFQFIRRGMGGTDFNSVLSRLAADGNTWPLVFLTDGRGEPPTTEPDFPVIWITTGECPPVGKCIIYGDH